MFIIDDHFREAHFILPEAASVQLFSFTTAARCQALTMTSSVYVAKTSAPIANNIYGEVLDHIGNIANGGVGSDMYVDRKFFDLVANVAATRSGAIGNAAEDPGTKNVPKLSWALVGGDSGITMDSGAVCSGDQTPTVRLNVSKPHSLRQSGLIARSKNTYTSRITVAHAPGTVFKVALIGHSGATGLSATLRFYPYSVNIFPHPVS